MRIFLLSVALGTLSGVPSIVGQQPAASPTPLVQKSTARGVVRERALAAMLEGQRYMWLVSRTRSQAVMVTNAGLARAAFARAIEADPSLAEAYTAIAELAVVVPPGDSVAGIDYANRALLIDRDNQGAHKILARLYTFRSGINSGKVDTESVRLAIAAWKEVTRLDPRNSEGWAFLAELYDELKQPADRIGALRKWLAGAQPVDVNFYRRVMGGGEDLRPEAAAAKLGIALVDAGEFREAVETLSLVVADAPEDVRAVEYLGRALMSSDARAAIFAIQPLQQAVFAQPGNLALIRMLAEAQRRGGRVEDAISGLKRSSSKLTESDINTAAQVDVVLGDVYAAEKRIPEAIAAYEAALRTRSIGSTPVAFADREFAISVFGKIIDVYRSVNRLSEANAVRERARRLLETADLFAS